MPSALSAKPDDREVREACFVAEALFDLVADLVKVLDRDRCDFAALLAVEVFEFLAAGEHPHPSAVAEVDVTHEAVALEQLEVSVNGRRVDGELPCELWG